MEMSEKAPAKLNLSLDTLFRHFDGEPEWRMVMTAVDLADYIHVKTRTDTQEITVKTDTGFLPHDKRNLAFQAALKLKKMFNINEGVDIQITKRIPVSAGMGGGSSDAAAVLRVLNKLWGLGLNTEQLAKIGLEIDSDVPFCVYSRTALVTGKGEKIQPLKSFPTSLWFVIAKPQESVSTPGILKQIDYTHVPHQNVDAVVEAINEQNLDKLTSNMGNVLEEITIRKIPQIKKIKEKMISFGAEVSQMSGTGPTVFGICKNESRALHVYNSLRGFCNEVYLVRPYNLSTCE